MSYNIYSLSKRHNNKRAFSWRWHIGHLPFGQFRSFVEKEIFVSIELRRYMNPYNFFCKIGRCTLNWSAFYTSMWLFDTHASWWRHQMEIFSALLALCVGNSPVTGEFLSQRPVTLSFDFFLICAWINRWVNNREAGDLRRHRAHYNVIVMITGRLQSQGTSAELWCFLYW